MKKKGFKKALAIVMAATVCLALPGIGTYAEEIPVNIGIAPANIIISVTENLLEWVGTNTLEIYGGTEVPHGYEAYVKVELQQKNGTSWPIPDLQLEPGLEKVEKRTLEPGKCSRRCRNNGT